MPRVTITGYESDLNGTDTYELAAEGIEGRVTVTHDTYHGEWEYLVDGDPWTLLAEDVAEALDDAEEDMQEAISKLDKLLHEEYHRRDVYNLMLDAENAALAALAAQQET